MPKNRDRVLPAQDTAGQGALQHPLGHPRYQLRGCSTPGPTAIREMGRASAVKAQPSTPCTSLPLIACLGPH